MTTISFALVGVLAITQQQAVQGVVSNADTGAPVVGAFVVLQDARDDRQGAVLTSHTGTFYVRVPEPGRYRLRVELIGFEDTTTPAFDVAAGEVVQRAIVARPRAIVLAPLDVAGEDRCRLPADAAGETLRLWEEARKALSLAVWVERSGVPHQAVLYERTRRLTDLNLIAELPHARYVVSDIGRSAFAAVPARDLARLGYVRSADDGSYEYFGLDAEVLLSDAFLDTHCFRVRRSKQGEPDVVGLGFEPVAGRTLPDVTGTLWLDRTTLALRYLEFTFTRHLVPGNIRSERFGGRVDFQRLTNGAWIVDRWRLRMPHLVEPEQRGAGGLQVRERGGELRFMAEPVAATPVAGAAVEGLVHDSTLGRPLAGATVFMSGSPHVTRTGPDGRFRLDGLPGGRREIGFMHPYSDQLALRTLTQPVRLTAGQTSTVDLAVPAGAACVAAEAGTMPRAMIVGFVISQDDGQALADVNVTARWEPGRDDTMRQLILDGRGERAAVSVVSDEDGRFLICDVPPGHVVQLQAARGPAVQLNVGAPVIMKQDLVGWTT